MIELSDLDEVSYKLEIVCFFQERDRIGGGAALCPWILLIFLEWSLNLTTLAYGGCLIDHQVTT